jgi:hypothetical protein
MNRLKNKKKKMNNRMKNHQKIKIQMSNNQEIN